VRIDTVVMLGVAGVTAVYAFATLRIPVSGISDPVGPRAFPLLIVAALVVTIALVMNETRRSAAARQPAGNQASGAMQGARVTAGVVTLSALFIVAFQPVGFVIAGTAYAFALMAWLNRGGGRSTL
jgi:hypothetical protein